MLGVGAIASPLFAAVIIAQGLTRDRFDFTRHPASILSNVSLGWIQVANFLVTGLLIAVGARRSRTRAGAGPGGLLGWRWPSERVPPWPGSSLFSSNQAAAVLAFDACVVIGLTWFTAMLWHERSHF